MNLSCAYIVMATILPMVDRIGDFLSEGDSPSLAGVPCLDVFEGKWSDSVISSVEINGIDSNRWDTPQVETIPIEEVDAFVDIGISLIEPQCGVEYSSVAISATDILSVEKIREFHFSYAVRGVDEAFADMVQLRLLYEQLKEGKEVARLPKWREPLLQMLMDGTPGTDFDNVYLMLLRGFPGPTDEMRIERLAKWTEGVNVPKLRGDVFRGETRYWINAGRFEMAIAAADRMQAAYPEYAVRAHRLRALSYASLGELDLAKKQVCNARNSRLPKNERFELLYLEAWILLQENEIGAAKRNLLTVLKESESSTMKRKAKHVLDSLKGEQ